MLMGRFAVVVRWVGFVESVTVTATVKDPGVIGVPLIRPAPLMERPPGKPVAENEYPGVPPDVFTWNGV
jgi:hypothetical protein